MAQQHVLVAIQILCFREQNQLDLHPKAAKDADRKQEQPQIATTAAVVYRRTFRADGACDRGANLQSSRAADIKMINKVHGSETVSSSDLWQHECVLHLHDRHDGDCGHDRSVKEGEFARIQRGRIDAVGTDEHARQAEHGAERIHGAPEIGEPAAGAEVKHDGPGAQQKEVRQKRSTRAKGPQVPPTTDTRHASERSRIQVEPNDSARMQTQN